MIDTAGKLIKVLSHFNEEAQLILERGSHLTILPDGAVELYDEEHDGDMSVVIKY